MKALFQSIIAKILRSSITAVPDAPLYEYPNDTDSSMEEAVNSIWKWYLRRGRQIQISVQGMGIRLESYHCEDALFQEGVLSWKNPDYPDRIKIQTEEEFRRDFLDWVKKRVQPYSETGDFSFGIEA